MNARPSREEAWKLLVEYVPSESLQRHALAVEAVMRHMARSRAEDEDAWGLVGMVHDIDYERYPEEHCVRAREILEGHGWPRNSCGRWCPTAGACARTWSPSAPWRRPCSPWTNSPAW